MVGARPLRVGRPRTSRASRPRRALHVSPCGGEWCTTHPGRWPTAVTLCTVETRGATPASHNSWCHRTSHRRTRGPWRVAPLRQAMLVEGSAAHVRRPRGPAGPGTLTRVPAFPAPQPPRDVWQRSHEDPGAATREPGDAWRAGGPRRAGAAARDRGGPHLPRCTRAVERSWRRWGPSPCHMSRRSWGDQTKGSSVSSTACGVRRRTIPPWHTPTLPVAEGSAPPPTRPHSPPHAAGPSARFACLHERVLGLGIHDPLHGTPLHLEYGTDLAIQSYRTSLRGGPAVARARPDRIEPWACSLRFPGQERKAATASRSLTLRETVSL